ncbi:ImpA domain-containing protein [Salmonella enterica subsp. enterica]|nr:ImpA domain-containing protein [Salmonella enterica subsp. enterica serovar Tornow]
MSQDALTHIIVTGQDPRGLPEFSALREEINKSSHPSQPSSGGGRCTRCNNN